MGFSYPGQALPIANFLSPVAFAATNTATVGNVIDTKGHSGLLAVDVHFGAFSGGGVIPSVFSFTEGDVSTNPTDTADAIPALTGGSGFTIPAAADLGDRVVRFHIDLRKRKRYLALRITANGTAPTVGAVGHFYDSDEQAITDEGRAVSGSAVTAVTTVKA